MHMLKHTARMVMTLTALIALGAPAWAQEGDGHDLKSDMAPGAVIELPQTPATATVTVMGHTVKPLAGLYVVAKDVNVRAGPDTTFKRVTGLKAGAHVRAVGKTENGKWMAVSKDGVNLGFIYAPILVAVVDGALNEQFTGSFMDEQRAGGVACDYRFRFERKSGVEGGSFETADYEVRFRCASSKGAALFYAHMFLTEAPVNERKGLHLIGLDVRSIGDGMEEFLTSRYLYHPKTGKMKFDGHSLPRFALPPQEQSFQTASIKDALAQALDASIASWTDEAWATLFATAQ